MRNVRKKFERLVQKGWIQFWLVAVPAIPSAVALAADEVGLGASLALVALAAMSFVWRVSNRDNILAED